MQELLIAVVVAILSLGLGVLLGRFVFPSDRDSKRLTSVIANLQGLLAASHEREAAATSGANERAQAFQERDKECARLNERLNAMTSHLESQSTAKAAAEEAQRHAQEEATNLRDIAARFEERANSLATQLEDVCAQLDASNASLVAERARTSANSEELARLAERGEALTRELNELRAQEGKLHDTMKLEFENIASKVLRANSAELSDMSRKQMSAIIDPLRERIVEFQGKVETTYDAEKREVIALKEQIRLVVEASQNLGSQADGLAKALKGDVQRHGRWGELVLERVLQAAGLEEGREFITQGKGLNLKSEAGGAQKPDVIIQLPDARSMIIDSKTPLTNYDRLVAATEPEERLAHTTQFVRDVKAHIDGLAAKRYQDNDKVGAHDCVLMFVPIEGALAAALTAEPELFTYAWDKRVVLVGPPTLLMTLRTVASIWRYEYQAANAQEIARLAGMLCDKISASLTDLNKTAERMSDAINAHSEAMKRLATGKGNVLSIGDRIKALGVKTKQKMPAVIVDGEPRSRELEFESDDEASGLPQEIAPPITPPASSDVSEPRKSSVCFGEGRS